MTSYYDDPLNRIRLLLAVADGLQRTAGMAPEQFPEAMDGLIAQARARNAEMGEGLAQAHSLIMSGESTMAGAIKTIFGEDSHEYEVFRAVSATMDGLLGLPKGTMETMASQPHDMDLSR